MFQGRSLYLNLFGMFHEPFSLFGLHLNLILDEFPISCLAWPLFWSFRHYSPYWTSDKYILWIQSPRTRIVPAGINFQIQSSHTSENNDILQNKVFNGFDVQLKIKGPTCNRKSYMTLLLHAL